MHRQHLNKVVLGKLKHEIKTLSRVRHDHLVEFVGASWDEPPNVLVCLEYMAGGELSDVIHSGSRFPGEMEYAEFCISVAKDVTTGLISLHGFQPLPIIHRDIKPAN